MTSATKRLLRLTMPRGPAATAASDQANIARAQGSSSPPSPSSTEDEEFRRSAAITNSTTSPRFHTESPPANATASDVSDTTGSTNGGGGGFGEWAVLAPEVLLFKYAARRLVHVAKEKTTVGRVTSKAIAIPFEAVASVRSSIFPHR